MPKCEDDLKAAKDELKAAKDMEKELRKQLKEKTTIQRHVVKGMKVVR